MTRAQTSAQRRRHKRQLLAAELTVAGHLTGEKIACAVGVDRRTVTRWKGQAAFAQAVEKQREQLRAAAQARFERDLAARLDRLFAIE